MLVNFGVTAELVASREGPSFMDIVSCLCHSSIASNNVSC
jgi:hypothetical protein